MKNGMNKHDQVPEELGTEAQSVGLETALRRLGKLAIRMAWLWRRKVIGWLSANSSKLFVPNFPWHDLSSLPPFVSWSGSALQGNKREQTERRIGHRPGPADRTPPPPLPFPLPTLAHWVHPAVRNSGRIGCMLLQRMRNSPSEIFRGRPPRLLMGQRPKSMIGRQVSAKC